MEEKELFLEGEDTTDWHEYRSPVSISEVKELYQGCHVRNDETYLEVKPSSSLVRNIGDTEYTQINLKLLIPTIMPTREGEGHYLPFECSLREDVFPLFGNAAAAILAPSLGANAYPCEIDTDDEGLQIKVLNSAEGAENVLVYTTNQGLEDLPISRNLKTFRLVISDKEFYCLLVPTLAIEMVCPLSGDVVADMMCSCQRNNEETEYLLAHSPN